MTTEMIVEPDFVESDGGYPHMGFVEQHSSPYMSASQSLDALAEVDRLNAEIERLTRDGDRHRKARARAEHDAEVERARRQSVEAEKHGLVEQISAAESGKTTARPGSTAERAFVIVDRQAAASGLGASTLRAWYVLLAEYATTGRSDHLLVGPIGILESAGWSNAQAWRHLRKLAEVEALAQVDGWQTVRMSVSFKVAGRPWFPAPIIAPDEMTDSLAAVVLALSAALKFDNKSMVAEGHASVRWLARSIGMSTDAFRAHLGKVRADCPAWLQISDEITVRGRWFRLNAAPMVRPFGGTAPDAEEVSHRCGMRPLAARRRAMSEPTRPVARIASPIADTPPLLSTNHSRSEISNNPPSTATASGSTGGDRGEERHRQRRGQGADRRSLGRVSRSLDDALEVLDQPFGNPDTHRVARCLHGRDPERFKLFDEIDTEALVAALRANLDRFALPADIANPTGLMVARLQSMADPRDGGRTERAAVPAAHGTSQNPAMEPPKYADAQEVLARPTIHIDHGRAERSEPQTSSGPLVDRAQRMAARAKARR